MVADKAIKSAAREAGFDLCGTAPCHTLQTNRSRFTEWLEKGYGSDLEYLKRYLDRRFNPADLVEGAKTVIVCGVNYRNLVSEGYPDGFNGLKTASYAVCRDYHLSIKEMAGKMLSILQTQYPELHGRTFTDTAPIIEKAWAFEAGLGNIGRNSLLITPQFGSFVLLGEIVIDDYAETSAKPAPQDICKGCRACIEHCPNHAITEEYTVDTRLCTSALSLEGKTRKPEMMHGWVCGCDLCQTICPHNKHKPLAENTLFSPLFNPFSAEGQSILNKSVLPKYLETTPLARAWQKKLK